MRNNIDALDISDEGKEIVYLGEDLVGKLNDGGLLCLIAVLLVFIRGRYREPNPPASVIGLMHEIHADMDKWVKAHPKH